MANTFFIVFMILLLGWIGSLFGSVGMFIGGILGLAAAIAKNRKDEVEKETISINPSAKLDFKEEAVLAVVPPVQTSGTIINDISNKYGSADRALYTDVVVEIMAAIIAADSIIEELEIEAATLLIENDDLITDKRSALDVLNDKVGVFFDERTKSKAIFKLKSSSTVHRINELKTPYLKDRLLIISEGLHDSINEGDKDETREILDKIKSVMSDQSPNSLTDRRHIAEEYIMKSGDKEAVELLKKIKKQPGNYGNNLKEAAKGNSILRTGLGVFGGMIAANLVTGAIRQYQLDEALSKFDANVEGNGGLENFQPVDDSNYISASNTVTGLENEAELEDGPDFEYGADFENEGDNELDTASSEDFDASDTIESDSELDTGDDWDFDLG